MFASGHFGSGIMWIFPIIGIFVMCLLCFVFCRKKIFSCCNSQKNNENNNETALDILYKRYAKGEITKDEFEQMKKDITN
jgi:putative membrane protein